MHGNILQHSGAPARRRLRATRRLGGWVVGWALQIWSEEACGGGRRANQCDRSPWVGGLRGGGVGSWGVLEGSLQGGAPGRNARLVELFLVFLPEST